MESVANDVEGAATASVAGSVVLPISSNGLFWPLGDKKEKRSLVCMYVNIYKYIHTYIICLRLVPVLGEGWM